MVNPFPDLVGLDIHTELEAEAARLLRHYDLAGWTFAWDTAVRRFGQCRYRDKVITLSRRLTELNPAEARDTLLHEVAHAVVGPRVGHGPHWKTAATMLGARPKACYDGLSVVRVVVTWEATCPDCGKVIGRTRHPARTFVHTTCTPKPHGGRLRFKKVGETLVQPPLPDLLGD